MAPKTTKVAISLPKKTLEEVERRRRDMGIARSTAIFEAIQLWLQQKRDDELDIIYRKGYRRKPERLSSSKPLYRAGISSFSKDNW